MKQMYLSVVIPCYNAEHNIRRTLARVGEFLRETRWAFEIILVDDGSRDGTVTIIEEFIEGKKEFRLIKNQHRGKGYTVRTGMLAARGKYVLFSDADLATPIEEVKKLLLWVEEQGFDIAIASREGVGARREDEPMYRHIMGRVFNWLVQRLAL
ncbi:glycosyltransferase, partial [Candidatus Parcubacteria bacterium]|nr:glycosyltransferase [Candidatus Parcubacteria bacterium]